LLNFLRDLVPGELRIESETDEELSIHLPTECTPFFPSCFDTLEPQQKVLGIAKMKVSYTLMEEVYKK
jgi:hypothetical protein